MDVREGGATNSPALQMENKTSVLHVKIFDKAIAKTAMKKP